MRPRDLEIGTLFERIRDAAIVADAKTQQIVLWNQAATIIFGYSTSEALGMRVEALVPEYLKDKHRAGIARYAETGHGPYIDSPRLLELPALRNGGEEIYIELSLSPIGPVDDADGSERYVLAIVRDITQRKRAEAEVRRLTKNLENRVAKRTEQLKERERRLRESEERYRSFIMQSPLSIQILSPDGRTLQVNRAWEELWGVTFEDIAGYNLLEDQQLVAKGIMPYIQRGFAGEPTSDSTDHVRSR